MPAGLGSGDGSLLLYALLASHLAGEDSALPPLVIRARIHSRGPQLWTSHLPRAPHSIAPGAGCQQEWWAGHEHPAHGDRGERDQGRITKCGFSLAGVRSRLEKKVSPL